MNNLFICKSKKHHHRKNFEYVWVFKKTQNMQKYLVVILVLTLGITSCNKNATYVQFQSSHFHIGIDNSGFVTELVDTDTRHNYLSPDTIAPLLSCGVGEKIYYPVLASNDGGLLTIGFDGGMEAKIKVEEKESHLTFELIGFNEPESIEFIAWGPFPTTINEVIGETVGVVRGEEFAIGLQALNPKTLGGFPWTDNDCTPQINIFEQDDYSDLSEENKSYVLYRVEAAKPEDFGSTLQAYCRNRNTERVISNLNHDRFISPVFEDGGIIGSKIALFGCPVETTLETIEKIEIEEGLPHPIIDGVWGKKSRSASAAYLIYGFSEENIVEAIGYTKKAGLRYLYHPGPFKTWGHFELNDKEFPNGWDGLKNCVKKAGKEGIYVGLHTLSNFINTNDPYVSPVPDPRLGKVGSSVLTEDIDNLQTKIPIQSADFFDQYRNNHLHTVMIGEELIRYGKVSDNEPYRLLDCERGAWGTISSSHKSGDKVSKLIDHGYKVFLTNPEMSVEVAEKIAELYNYCGLSQISFDGLEGNRSTGMGNYGEIIFTNTWWESLSEEERSHLIIDASRTTHYFWHMYSRMNWGEPWYAGFRESQTQYRLKNQEYFQRNMMPGMLGWFSMRNNTTVEDIEWMLARSAAFDAGYAFVSGKMQFDENGQTDKILSLIAQWEKARMAGAFSDDQKERMKDISNDFHLETLADGGWNLYPVHSYKFTHEMKIRQPGEPLYSEFNFEYSGQETIMGFIITAQDAGISEITLEFDHSRELKLPVELSEGQSLKYNGGLNAQVLSATLQMIGEIKMDPSLFQIEKGQHSIQIDCSFSDPGKEPVAKLEVRVQGEAEALKKTE